MSDSEFFQVTASGKSHDNLTNTSSLQISLQARPSMYIRTAELVCQSRAPASRELDSFCMNESTRVTRVRSRVTAWLRRIRKKAVSA